ncbi:hypothetical protein [Microbacterium sp.]|uniref:DUF7507 domain-containing protein n=1 Tax=Microbacterium sp. TaxID=51671 RepID=UPI0039E2F19A
MKSTPPVSLPASASPRRRLTAMIVIVAVFVSALVSTLILSPSQRAWAAVCEPGSIYVNHGALPYGLGHYSADGTLIEEAPLARAYGDIGFSGDGATLYGISFTNPPRLFVIDETTGAETSEIPLIGAPATSLNSLSALPNGNLLAGGPSTTVIYEINPTTGVVTPYGASFPAGYASAGDFLSLADGDILATATSTADSSRNFVIRIHPDMSRTVVGSIPISWGAAQTGGRIYLGGSNGVISLLNTVPTAASTAPLAVTPVTDTGRSIWGATSRQDSGLCPALEYTKSVSPASGTMVSPGDTLTYTLELSNAEGLAAADILLTDDLSGVIDDATVTTPPAVTSGASLAIGAITPEGTFSISGSLAAGAESTITYTVTVDDPVTGDHSLANFLLPTGTTPPASCDPASGTCTVNPIPGISLAKSATPIGTDTFVLGQEIQYSFVVTNTGTTTLTDVSVDETSFSGAGAMSAITPASVATLAPGAQATFTASYTLQQGDIDDGELLNEATAEGTPPSGPPITSPPSQVELPGLPDPSLSVVKTADVQSFSEPGQQVGYSFLVTNTGNVTLTDVSVDETAFTGAPSPTISPATAGPLLPGQQATFTATYTTTQADLDAGGVTNTAVARATPPSGPDVDSPPSTVEVPAVQSPLLELQKSASPDDVDSYVVGQEITYTFLVRNAGNVTMTGVTVGETEFTGSGSISAITPASVASLAPGAEATFTATYTLTQADVDAEGLLNTAVAQGTPPGGPPVDSPPSSVRIPVDPAPSLTVVKSADVEEITAAGQQVLYSFLVTNTGNVTLTDVSVNDTDFTGSGTLGAITPSSVATLAPGAETTFTATYTVTQADLDGDGVSNTATATGTPPEGPPVESPPSTVDLPPVPDPALTLVKSATPSDADSFVVGQVIDYSFVVTNTGNLTLTDITVDETAFSGAGALSPISPASVATLAPGDQAVFTASYEIQQADLDAGELTNSAVAAGTPPDGPPVESPPSTVEIPADPAPAVSVVKSADIEEITSAGQAILYRFLVTNTGNVTLSTVSVTDEDFTGTGVLSAIAPASAGPLLPGEQAVFTATYTTTQADMDGDGISNSATATGVPPSGPPVDSPPSTVEIPTDPQPALTVVKSATPSDADSFVVGQVIDYRFVVTNTGNVTLTDVSVAETAFSGTGAMSAITPASVATLAPGAQAIFSASYTLTQDDVDAGQLTNTAIAEGTPPDGPPVESPPSTVEVPVDPDPALTVVKTASAPFLTEAGQELTYSFLVTNTGNVTLTDVSVAETAFTGTGTAPVITPDSVETLIPGQQATFTATYTVTQADLDGAGVSNTAVATGTPPDGPPVDSPPSTVVVPPTQSPALALTKSADADGPIVVGQEVTYSFLVVNTGNVTLTGVTVEETDFTGSGTLSALTPASVATLAPGGEQIFTATYVVTQADVDAGAVRNTAVGTGTPPTGPVVESPPSTVELTAEGEAALTVVKSASPSDEESFVVGQEITYSFVVTNTGTLTLDDVTIDEGEFTGSGELSPLTPASVASLAPGEQAVFTATYVLTQADVDASLLRNTATAVGTPPDGPDIESPPSTVELPADPAPSLSIVKTADHTRVDAAGTVIAYRFLVTNTGNVTLTEVTVDETEFTGAGEAPVVTCPSEAAALLPGEQVTCTASYTVVEADLDRGDTIRNTATASGTPPTGDPVVSDPSSAEVDVADSGAGVETGGYAVAGGGIGLPVSVAILLLGLLLAGFVVVRRRRLRE